MTAPFPRPARWRAVDFVVLGGAVVVGAAIGFGAVAVALGRDLFDKYVR